MQDMDTGETKKRKLTLLFVLLIISHVRNNSGELSTRKLQALNSNMMTSTSDINPETRKSTIFADLYRESRNTIPVMEELLQSSTATPIDVCSEYGSCDYQSTFQQSSRYCHCDELCYQYNDCCHDANITVSNVQKQQLYECTSPVINGAKIYGYFIVRQCPVEFLSLETNQLCISGDVLSTGPWVVSGDNIIYQNRFCAECHGVTVFTQFTVKLSNVWYADFEQPEEQITVANLITSKTSRVDIEMIPKNEMSHRRCLVFKPPSEGNKEVCIESSVIAVQYVTKTKLLVFRNSHCRPEMQEFACFDVAKDYSAWGKNTRAFPLSVLFSSWHGESCSIQETIEDCYGMPYAENYPVDDIRPFIFLSSYTMTEESVRTFVTLFAYSLSASVSIKSFRNIRFYMTSGNLTHSYIYFEIEGELSVTVTVPRMKILVERFRHLEWEFLIEKPNKIAHELISHNNSLDVESLDLMWKIPIIPKKDVNTKIIERVKASNIASNLNQNFECLKQQIKCSQFGNSTSATLEIYSIECISYRNGDGDQRIIETVQIYLTYIGLTTSALSLVGSIIVYRITQMYQSVPGSLVQSLFISLLLSSIVFMSGIGASEYHVVCYCIGVILHYLWLVVFTFKSVGLIHLTHSLKTMTNPNGPRTDQSNRIKLNLLCLIIPLAFVAPSIAFDYFNLFDLRLDYNNRVCFPTGFPGNFIFVSVPIGLSVLTNVCCFLSVVFIISRNSMNTRTMERSNSYRFASIYIRISIVTGMFWISGILGSVLKNEVTDIIFITLCSFQGLFVAIAYMSSKTVSKQLRDKSSS